MLEVGVLPQKWQLGKGRSYPALRWVWMPILGMLWASWCCQLGVLGDIELLVSKGGAKNSKLSCLRKRQKAEHSIRSESEGRRLTRS